MSERTFDTLAYSEPDVLALPILGRNGRREFLKAVPRSIIAVCNINLRYQVVLALFCRHLAEGLVLVIPQEELLSSRAYWFRHLVPVSIERRRCLLLREDTNIRYHGNIQTASTAIVDILRGVNEARETQQMSYDVPRRCILGNSSSCPLAPTSP